MRYTDDVLVILKGHDENLKRLREKMNSLEKKINLKRK